MIPRFKFFSIFVQNSSDMIVVDFVVRNIDIGFTMEVYNPFIISIK